MSNPKSDGVNKVPQVNRRKSIKVNEVRKPRNRSDNTLLQKSGRVFFPGLTKGYDTEIYYGKCMIDIVF